MKRRAWTAAILIGLAWTTAGTTSATAETASRPPAEGTASAPADTGSLAPDEARRAEKVRRQAMGRGAGPEGPRPAGTETARSGADVRRRTGGRTASGSPAPHRTALEGTPRERVRGVRTAGIARTGDAGIAQRPRRRWDADASRPWTGWRRVARRRCRIVDVVTTTTWTTVRRIVDDPR